MRLQSRENEGDDMEKVETTQLHRREEVAKILGISLRATDELILSKKIQSLKIGKRRLVSTQAISAFVRRAEASAR